MIQSILLISVVAITIIITAFTNKSDIPNCGIALLDKGMTQIYRGMAIIWVMMQHCGGALGTNILTPLGGGGVAIFLFLSGYGLTESFKKKGMQGFLHGRIWRVWLPFSVFSLGIHLLQEEHDYNNMLLNMFSIRQDDYWYVHYMLRCYLAFWISFRFFYKYRWIIFGIFTLYTFFYMDSIRAEQCLSFQLGILISEHKASVTHMHKRSLISIMIVFGFIGIASLAIKQLPIVREMSETVVYSCVQLCIKLPLAITAMLAIWMLPHKWIVNNPVLIICGRLSYEIYLVHMQLLGLAHSWSSAFVMLFISGLIAYSLHIYFKRIQSFSLK